MRCSSCEADNPEGARFCAMCGDALGATCTRCDARIGARARFCTECGEPVGVKAATTSPSPPAGEPLSTAERRRVSVMFVDLVNFTSLSESMDPEDVRRIQSRYFEAARAVVARYEGTIEKFIGDAVMAVWGAPVAHEDDPERAVRAALGVVDAVGRLGGPSVRRPLRARAAVTTGDAVVTVGAMGQGMVSGDLVNVAGRLQSRAPVGGVLVDAATRERAPKAARFEPVGSLSLKGRTAHVGAYRATEAKGDAASGHAAGHTGPFIGRERELRELTDLLGTVMRERRSRLVSVTGIAGIGKSRLAWELGNWVDALDQDVAWHDGRSLAYGEGIAFAAVAQMVRRRIRITEGAPPELARRQLATALDEFVADDAERRWIEPRLAALVLQEEAAAFDRDELFAAWRRFFERIADRMPVVLVFEDVQWADPALMAFIEHVAAWSRHLPIFMVTLARPEFLDRYPSWGARLGSFTAIELERLPDDAMRQLLAAHAPRLPRGIVRQVLDRAGGVPLYAVEVARILEQQRGEEGVDRRVTGRGADGPRLDVPDSLHGLIAARIDSLPADERRLLLAASVLGHRFRPEALVAIVESDAGVTRERIDQLVRREMLNVDEELNSPGRGELAFVQDLVRDVAYQTLSLSERRHLHLAAARFLESYVEGAAEPLSAHLVAAHRLTTDRHEARRLARRAVSALRHAARNANALHVPERALGLLENALRLSAGADERAPLLEEVADAASAAGRLDVAEERLRELVTIQVAKRQRAAAARTRARLAGVLLSAQRNAPALAELEAAMRSVRGWERDASGVELAAQLARARTVVGEDAEALVWADRALVAAQRLNLTSVAIDLLVTRGTARLSLGQVDAGSSDLRDAVAQAEDAGSLHIELRARNNLAWSLLGDDPRAAMETAREGFDLATQMGLGDRAVPLADVACTAAVETGDWAWALSTIDELEERGVTDAYRVIFASTAAVIRALQGEESPMDPVDELGPLPADTDTQVIASVEHARAWTALVRGEFDEARRLAESSVAGFLGSDPTYQRALATRACLWVGDLSGAKAGVDRLDATGRSGRASLATLTTMQAGVSALEGASDADATYRRATELWTELELPLQLALCMLDRHRLRGGEPADVAAAVDALGANGLLRLISGDDLRFLAGDSGRRPAARRRKNPGPRHETASAPPVRSGTERPRSR